MKASYKASDRQLSYIVSLKADYSNRPWLFELNQTEASKIIDALLHYTAEAQKKIDHIIKLCNGRISKRASKFFEETGFHSREEMYACTGFYETEREFYERESRMDDKYYEEEINQVECQTLI